ncbi:MAG: type II toxin-antitoxin system RelE/ParE family toxin [Proteobacteria bacterium]|nr:type II toxin-antitoxin system RelE/ParE family toxin [Pseudomonadota bacterium]
MPREIVWLPAAVLYLVRLRDFIREKNLAAVIRAASRIKEAVQILVENPGVGRPVDEALPFRDLIIPFGSGNYVLRYREEGAHIVIVRIRHNREDSFL